MKLNQYCSVCKKHLDMDVIPTDDGGDDGVIWLRCPECQGFLPKFTGAGGPAPVAADDPPPAESAPTPEETAVTPEPSPRTASPPPPSTSSPAEVDDEVTSISAGRDEKDGKEPEPEPEPIAEYAAQLAACDPESARPYRPDQRYALGDLIHHLAYDDLGVVVAKEDLPGGRKVVKTFFERAGIVRLIEQAVGR